MEEPRLIHLSIEPFRAACGANEPNQHTAALGCGTTTCPECILMHPDADAWNLRFLCYAAAHQREPEAQLAHDRQRYPGGAMAGYVTWIGERHRHYKALSRGDMDFDSWLKATTRRPKKNVPILLRRAARALCNTARNPRDVGPTQGEIEDLIDSLRAEADRIETAEQVAKALEPGAAK